MLIAVVLVALCLGAGYLSVRTLRLQHCGFGVVPAAGVGALAVIATWCIALRVPPPLGGMVVLLIGVAGLAFAARDAWQRRPTEPAWRQRDGRAGLAVLALAIGGPLLMLVTAFGGVQVPLSTHDGAYHTEVIHAFRVSGAVADWYPKGMASLVASVLQLVPWADSAQGAWEAGYGLAVLAVLAVIGLGLVVYRDVLLASLAGLLLSLTYLYPYFPQIWSGWPLTLGLILVMGLWALALEYLRAPSWRWAVLGGVLLGAIVLVHGSEIYTTAIVLSLVLLTHRGPVRWYALVPHVLLGAAVALLCAAPYLPTLLAWAAGGGAYSVAIGGEQPLRSDPVITPELPLHAVFAIEALGIDLPLRLILLVAGVVSLVRRRVALGVLAVGAGFVLLTWLFTSFGSQTVVRTVYAVTFPWGMHYRLLMVVAIAQSLIACAGLLALRDALTRFTGSRPALKAARPSAAVRTLRRLGRLLLVTWLVLATWALGAFMSLQVAAVHAYSDDDAAAMTWLRSNVPAGVLVANDGYADAGIWAPYKAGVEILSPRSHVHDGTAEARQLVAANILRLDQEPQAMSAACALRVGYVYRGAQPSSWDTRQVPPTEELLGLPYLELAFASGQAGIYRLRLTCPTG